MYKLTIKHTFSENLHCPYMPSCIMYIVSSRALQPIGVRINFCSVLSSNRFDVLQNIDREGQGQGQMETEVNQGHGNKRW